MYKARRRVLTGNNRPEEPGALASDSDSSPPLPPPLAGPDRPCPTPPHPAREASVTPAV